MKFVTRSLRSLATKLHILAPQADIFVNDITSLLYFNDITSILYFNDITSILYFNDIISILYFNDITSILYFNDITSLLYFNDITSIQIDLLISEEKTFKHFFHMNYVLGKRILNILYHVIFPAKIQI
jgi:hypothetical protein